MSDIGEITTICKPVMKIFFIFIFFSGTIKIVNGIKNAKQDGKEDIVYGALMVAAPFIMYAIFDSLGLGDSVVNMNEFLRIKG